MDNPTVVNPEEHLRQLLMTLQRIELDAKALLKMAESGDVKATLMRDTRADIKNDLDMVNARLVFACSDMEALYVRPAAQRNH